MSSPDHSVRKHALLSASGASRWLNCTPSARLEESNSLKESTSIYAEEGTLAHEFGDVNLQYWSADCKKRVALGKELAELRKHKLYTDEMEDQVAKYTDYVGEQYTAALKSDKSATLLVEEKVDLTHLIEDGFGTCDANVIADGTLEIIDLKYGKGVRVSAEDNPQLKLYGLGALDLYDFIYEIDTVKLTIVQPRLDHISSWEISAADLLEWAEKEVKPKAKLAYAGEGKTCAGDWCKWCKVKAKCKALADKNLELAKHAFRDPNLLTDEEVLEVYKQIPGLSDWANAVNDYVLKQALNGKDWEGFKLVEGRSVRKWKDEKQALEALEELGFKPEQLTNTKIKGIGEIEKLVTKVKFSQSIAPDNVIKPAGKLAIVPESDKRPAVGVQSAKEVFK